jgi:hypothetical protein
LFCCFATTSSIRAEYVRPLLIYKAKRAISLRTGSKQERIIFRCIINNDFYPVAASKSNVSSFTTNNSTFNIVRFNVENRTQFSTASSVPTLNSINDFLASCCAVNLASIVSWIWHCYWFRFCFKSFYQLFFASSADNPEITSNCCNWLYAFFSTLFLSKLSILVVYSAVLLSKSSTFALESSLEIWDSFISNSFSTSATLSLERITCSCSDFSSINFSLLEEFYLFFMFSASGYIFKMTASFFLIKLEILFFSMILRFQSPLHTYNCWNNDRYVHVC